MPSVCDSFRASATSLDVRSTGSKMTKTAHLMRESCSLLKDLHFHGRGVKRRGSVENAMDDGFRAFRRVNLNASYLHPLASRV